jgi:hypothetical protein
MSFHHSNENSGSNLLLRVFTGNQKLATLNEQQWDILLSNARSAKLLAKLAFQAKREKIETTLPTKVRDQLDWAERSFENKVKTTRWEFNRIERALETFDAPVILLKGAAYLAAGLSMSQGRVATDVDIMVPRDALKEAESALLAAGWAFEEHDEYDDRFYREWMHELPPLYHTVRRTVLDLHHTILPLTSRLRVESNALIAEAVPLPGSRFFTLSQRDMILHSVVHLFQDSELNGDLRDLIDISELLRDFGDLDGFWQALFDRVAELGLNRPFYYAVHFNKIILGTSYPPFVEQEIERLRPPLLTRVVMDFCVPRALLPCVFSRPDYAHRLSILILYMRSHWLRMPTLLLARHLFTKALRKKHQGED